jgi:hypothetical protein
MARKSKPAGGFQPNNALTVEQSPDETGAQAMARRLLEPHARHALTASTFAKQMLGGDNEAPGMMDFVDHMQSATSKAEAGDLAIASRLLAAQAITLDSMFTELARRTALNMSEYVNAAERYGRLALKAQNNCRATLDQVHNHPGALGNDETIKQSLTTANAGAVAALPSPDPLGNGVPVPCGKRK